MWLRNGLTIDCRRLIEEVGFRPRTTIETVEDFVERPRGRRVLPDLRDTPIGGNGSRARVRAGA
jgi:hypothetical protein